jgi:hypothetical protein
MQEIAVFVIVALAAICAAWKLMPRALRVRLAQAMVGWARRRGRLSDHEAIALARRLTASGCGSCESCGACGPPDHRSWRIARQASINSGSSHGTSTG